jgi:hypothetical protein
LVTVVIPVRDAAGLPLMLRALPPVDEVIVVASPAAAGPAAAAIRRSRPDALLVQPARPGLGAALSSGIEAGSGDVVVTLNGDGSTDPSEIPRYVEALVRGADVALGSRYADGGRDLTGGRLRRWADVLLIWWVNVLFGTRRTDPGFGYAAFWRDSADRLGLPDPSARAAAGWGDGPEIGPLLALRAAARGLRVAEVPSVAFPRMRPGTAGDDRAGLRHWVRAAATEYSRRGRRIARHSAVGPAPVPATAPALATGPAPVRTASRGTPSGGRLAPASTTSNRPPAWPSSYSPAADPQPRSGEPSHPGPFFVPSVVPVVSGSTPPRREVGSRRRRLETYRQPRPDLRVINGEGSGTRGRSGRLRSVPRQNPG